MGWDTPQTITEPISQRSTQFDPDTGTTGPPQQAKEHLPGDIIDILERLGKADNIPFNQLYYIAKNCADHYYSKVY